MPVGHGHGPHRHINAQAPRELADLNQGRVSEDKQIDLVALTWPGRDDYSASDWLMVREEAAPAHNDRTAECLIGTPLVGDFLEEGLSKLGYSCEEYEINRP